MPVPHVLICGRSGSGKTTLIERLVKEFSLRGLSVGVLKHTSHSFSIDTEGKDTWRFRRAGAERAGIASEGEFAVSMRFHESRGLDYLLKYYDGVDLVLVEGYKREPRPKIEVTAGSAESDLECAGDPNLLAVAGKAPVGAAVDLGVPFFDRDDYPGIADFIARRVLRRIRGAGE